MTETYNGAWSPVKGDVKEVKQDVYHSYPVSKKESILNNPYAEAYKVRAVEQVQAVQGK